MDEDGLAQLLESKQQGVFQLADGFDEDLEDLKRAEEGCPVDIISIEA